MIISTMMGTVIKSMFAMTVNTVGCLMDRFERSDATPPMTNPSHRKSNSLDGTDRKSRQLVPPVRERYTIHIIRFRICDWLVV